MNKLSNFLVFNNTTLKNSFVKIENLGKGILLLVDDNLKLIRTVTDGDLRRLLLKTGNINITLDNLPKLAPVTITYSISNVEALKLMNDYAINHLPILGVNGDVVDIIYRSDLDKKILLSTPHLGGEEINYISDAIQTNWVAPVGPNIDAFENEIASYVGIQNAAAVSSGTAAIHLALRVLNISSNDLVYCSSLTFVGSVNPILYQCAQPVFIDSEMMTWNMCPKALERAFHYHSSLGKLPKAVIVVSLYGQSANMDPLLDLCKFYKVPLIEDAAESLGAIYKHKYSGTMGDLGIYSFNGNKIITTSGGGMLVSNNSSYIDRAKYFATQAKLNEAYYEHTEVGYNYRMSNILAGIGRGQLKVIENRINSRREIFEKYSTSINNPDQIKWMPTDVNGRSTHWLSSAILRRHHPELIIERLSNDNIEARRVWKPMHMQPLFRNCDYFTASSEIDNSRYLFEHGICFPSGSNLRQNEIDRVISSIHCAIM